MMLFFVMEMMMLALLSLSDVRAVGRSMLKPFWMTELAAIMKMMRSTSSTSVNGVMLISAIMSSPPSPALTAMETHLLLGR